MRLLLWLGRGLLWRPAGAPNVDTCLSCIPGTYTTAIGVHPRPAGLVWLLCGLELGQFGKSKFAKVSAVAKAIEVTMERRARRERGCQSDAWALRESGLLVAVRFMRHFTSVSGGLGGRCQCFGVGGGTGHQTLNLGERSRKSNCTVGCCSTGTWAGHCIKILASLGSRCI
jgi:hypothetical protein